MLRLHVEYFLCGHITQDQIPCSTNVDILVNQVSPFKYLSVMCTRLQAVSRRCILYLYMFRPIRGLGTNETLRPSSLILYHGFLELGRHNNNHCLCPVAKFYSGYNYRRSGIRYPREKPVKQSRKPNEKGRKYIPRTWRKGELYYLVNSFYGSLSSLRFRPIALMITN